MPDIVLATLNAKFIHTSLGLRYLLANLDPHQTKPNAVLLEFDLQQRPLDIAEQLLARQPRILGLGVYVWNAAPTTELVALLKVLRPDLHIVLGGPEVSYETQEQEIARLADHVIAGEADLEFPALCAQILAGQPPPQKIITAPPPDLSRVALPYRLYTDPDIRQRTVYVEASRGCPFTCEFCLSSLDIPVRRFPLDRFLDHLGQLLDRGTRHLKFVDRTFNLDLAVSRRILEFCLAQYRPGVFYHFEMIPDRLPTPLRDLLTRFPAGALQLELGIQTFNPQVADRIRRRQDNRQAEANLRFLREQTHAHIHTDLIAGLPGESLESFATGFDRLLRARPQEIQVGILKRLRGAPIARHSAQWGMIYSPLPPYEILAHRQLDFTNLQRLRRFARFWDLIGNSGNFVETTPLLWGDDGASPFDAFMALCDWLFQQTGQQHAIALARLCELVFQYLTTVLNRPATLVADRIERDWRRAGRRDVPPCLRSHAASASAASAVPPADPVGRRQRRHRTACGPQA
ncbi:MAG: DUF4080 domain-containing protein [Verrucomicrobia bacterium]|nr:DUF4080 domain-containing protein [Verrucomicrobiota bacterium]